MKKTIACDVATSIKKNSPATFSATDVTKWALLCFLCLGGTLTQAQVTLTFDGSDDRSNAFTKQAGDLNVTFHSPASGFFDEGPSGLLQYQRGSGPFTIELDRDAKWIGYDITQSAGISSFAMVGPGVNSSGNSTSVGAGKLFATPLLLAAGEEYRFTSSVFVGFSDSYFIQNLIFELLMDEATGRVNGTAAQLGFQNTSSAFQVLSRQLKQVSRAQRFASPLQPMALQQMESVNSISLVGYETAVPETTVTASATHRCCSNSIRNQWNGWVSGYGIGGDVQSDGSFAGLGYRGGGTQFGIYRNLNRGTLIGMFGGYSNQNVDGDDGDTADIESGQFGAFLHRSVSDNAYLMAAGSGGFDSYRTRSAAGANAEFDGAQAATYLELGRQARWGRARWNPSLALQYVYLHQEDHTEVGTAVTTIDSVNEHSLRSIVGGTAQGAARKVRTGQITPYASLHWMHEFLDTTTNVTGVSGGTGFTTNGVSLGRDWAMVGGGASYSVNSYSNLYAGYELQINDRQTFHTGDGGIQFSW